MLPGPDDCWLADQDGQRYTSELRMVAVDLGRRASQGRSITADTTAIDHIT